MELDTEQIKKKLDLEKQGRFRGEKERPESGSESLDDVEQRIVALIDAENKLCHEKLINHLKTYGDRIRSLALQGLISEAVASADGASADFKARVHDGADVLFQLRRDVARIEDEIAEFKSAHGLRRMAHYPRSQTLRWGIVFILLLIESVLNGTFLARGHELGLTGGVAEALAIALVNIGVGLWIGWKVVPNIMHRNIFRKLGAAILVAVYAGGIVGFNLLVAHYRDALVGAIPDNAAELAFQSFMSAPLSVGSVQSWLLFAMGMGFSLLAAGDGWTMDDPYPGYGKLARKQSDLIEEYVEQKSELMEQLERIRDEALERLSSAGRDIERRRNEYHQITQSRQSLKTAYVRHLDHLEHCVRYLLASYRQANQEARSSPAPAHFAETWEIDRSPDPAIDDEPGHEGADIDQKIEVALESVPEQRRRIHADYESAVHEYRKIEQLTPDALRDGAVSKTAA